MSFSRDPNNEDFSKAERAGEAEIDSLAGKRVGIYRLETKIGKGGMGAVYAARRDDGEFRQKVAVKLIRRGMDTDFVLNRFRHERQILASLEHPFIARLLDGGTTDDGLPYFVMDFIEGEPLIEYAEKNSLDLRARLELFRRVCEAVGFAHRKQIVHRDLKPSNILITKNGMPKLLDFGIAKLLNPEDAAETLMPTQTQMRLMTAEYAAPEQIRGEQITPATDVYSLGILLYELTTGSRPYQFPSRSPYEIARVVCEENAQLPKFKVLNLEIDQFAAENLSNVILKALQKQPKERYGSVKEFSADIEKILKGKPAGAKPPAAQIQTAPLVFSDLTPTGSHSIAVLPLRYFSASIEPDTDDRFLSIGLADALIARLSSVRRFILRPTSAVLRYGESGIDSFRAGAELNVEFVVDGHIQKSGDRIRISVQLLNVAERAIIWAERFDEKYTDVLELEDAISNRVAESLIPKLTGEERRRLDKRGTDNPKAYEAYLRGRFYWNQFTPESLPKSLESFQKAVALDPNYALAYVGLSDFYIWANIYGIIPSLEATRLAEAAAERAVELNEYQGEAYATLGLINQNQMNWSETNRFYEKSLELLPNYVHAHEWRAAFFVGSGNFEAGVREIKFAEQLDPLSLRTKTLTAWTLYQARRFEEALEVARQIIELDKNYPQGYAQIGNNLLALKRAREAVSNFQIFNELTPQSALAKYQLCFALAGDNQLDAARMVLEEIKTLAASGHVKPYFLAMAHAAVGEIDAAFEKFEQALNEFEPWMLWLGTEPMLDRLRGDKRYFDLLRRMKNPIIEQQTKGEK
jgi:serine/threonine protein kinase/Tfp pilus assembly protein PilF